MTDHFEQRLSVELHEHTPEPLRELTAEDVWAGKGRAHPRAFAVGGGVLVAAAAAITVVVTGTGRDSVGPTQPPLAASSSHASPALTGRASGLLGRTWVLTSPHRQSAAGHMWISFERSGVVRSNGCGAAAVSIHGDRMTFLAPFRTDLANCGWRGTNEQDNAVRSLLLGTVGWSLRGQQLTLEVRGHRPLLFMPAHHRSGADRVRISGRLLAVGGPAGTGPQSMPGTVTAVDVRTGATYAADATAADGRYTVEVPAGKYRLVGRSPDYGNGAADCQAVHPVIASRSTGAITADVFCQRR
ncbi:MAG TPA: hypothetical protein VFH38_05315 [Jatrophihabitans sp.]|nr:hypothetical protein [Jatrophihabitans sp.]